MGCLASFKNYLRCNGSSLSLERFDNYVLLSKAVTGLFMISLLRLNSLDARMLSHYLGVIKLGVRERYKKRLGFTGPQHS